jgi:hypothetical protein
VKIETIFFSLEAAPGFEPGIRALQAHALPLGYAATVMVPGAGLEPAQCYHRGILSPLRLPISPSGLHVEKNISAQTSNAMFQLRSWSGKRGSNSRPQPWQGCALPLSYSRIVFVDWKYSKKTMACKEALDKKLYFLFSPSHLRGNERQHKLFLE